MSILTGSQGMLLIPSESKGSLLRFGKEYTAKTRGEGKSENRRASQALDKGPNGPERGGHPPVDEIMLGMPGRHLEREVA